MKIIIKTLKGESFEVEVDQTETVYILYINYQNLINNIRLEM